MSAHEIVTWVRTPPDAPKIRGTESRCSECASVFDRWTKGRDAPLEDRSRCPSCGQLFTSRPVHVVIEREAWTA